MKMAQLIKAGILWVLISNISIAETTSDNLLNNGNFSNQLNDWTVEDSSKIKYDSNCYAGGTDASGLCKSVRFSSDLGKTISQSITNLEEGYDINNINVSFTALGCNNQANSNTWCSQGTDYDKVQATIQLSNDVSHETLYLEQQLDYNDGTQNYNLSTQTLDSWTTDNTSINFAITGIDTGDWSGWYAPIVDNIELTLDITETIIPEPIIQPQTQSENTDIIESQPMNTVMEGIDLETSVLNEVVLEIPDIPEVEIIEVAVIEDIPVVEELPEINDIVDPIVEINDMPEIDELPEIEDIEIVEDIAEIEEIEVEEVAEQNDAKEDMEQSEEVAKKDVDQDNTDKKEEKAKKTEDKKDVKKEKKTVTAKKDLPKTKKQESNGVDIPVLYTLLTLEEGIKIVETIKIVEVIEYEQDITDYSTNVAWDNWVNTANTNWGNLDSVRPVYKAPSYRRKK